MGLLKLEIGEKVLYNGKNSIIAKIVDIDTVCIEEIERNIFHTINVSALEPHDNYEPERQLESLNNKEWAIASKRLEIIKPLINKKTNRLLIDSVAKENKVSRSTIYRWLEKYKKYKTTSSLAPTKKKCNKSRLAIEVDQIIYENIKKVYLNKSRYSINRLIRSVEESCIKNNLAKPHKNTIIRRIKSLSEEEVMRGRYGKSKADEKFSPKTGHFPGATFPLSVVQIDHNTVDVILVDEIYRQPLKKPNLTIAIDIYSRMILGFYVSFDPPGEFGTGICIYKSIMKKEDWLLQFEVEGTWPCWGIMQTIHLDNAKEFKGKMLQKAAINYGLKIDYRPTKKPSYGGHVERVIGTFSKEIHDLPGTTFSNIFEKGDYDSMRKASMTIKEFEKWLLEFIINIYHVRVHKTIEMPPLQKYREAIMGSDTNKPITGIPPVVINERRLRFDFMPYVLRTIQEYGVSINKVLYYSNVLKKYIHARTDNSKYSGKQQFLFRTDPRDISKIYFYDPIIEDYFEIPYRDSSYPPISKWELNRVVNHLKKTQNKNIDSDKIFKTYQRMKEIEENSKKDTKYRRLEITRMENKNVLQKKSDSIDSKIIISEEEDEFDPNAEPFKNIDYE
ncbi:Mu transposase C-terminal domain-containing protein [Flavobacterium sharifuzzamanii]|uniref:Mu transposase C-terminal domain-containing protein n=1 Tax=Flavobacterium sharifuzzamanii TaxID=2211133 RepID=UPI000DAE15B2|nr:Mu transposase C-terminal domain-containing protein [Flavobacterium sharifuzzamanii]KAF2082002.1 DDE-type integrase/transposase/recombinase [Flavobacterium sharifuzzamanii]